jgi:hypothetical protein
MLTPVSVAKDSFSETTIGYRTREEGEMWKKLFDTPTFRVSLIDDVAGVSLGGALKVRVLFFHLGFSCPFQSSNRGTLFADHIEHSRARCRIF